MFISQISVFAENRPGALAAITQILSDAQIDLRAFNIADTTDFGILRMIVDAPDRASAVLRDKSIVCSINRVIGIRMEDKPGAMNKVLTALAAENITVEYAYAFVSRTPGTAIVILRVKDSDRAAGVLSAAGFSLISQSEVHEF